ncbi:MAG: hypothetical protein H0V17_29865 [Deltaproteobacteria bacterium]|nr:hypothetical protein [Deltaproteobacteria bacterium]
MIKHTFLALALFVACGGDGANPDIPVQNRAVIVAGDFTPGSPGVMSALDLDIMAVEQRVAPTGSVGSDPVIRRFGTELFVVNRADGNNVTILDAVTFELVEQLATGPASNPQDVVVVGDEIYVAALGTAGVVVVQRGTGEIRTIDLSALDPADGQPDCVSVFKVDDDVFVACGLLDNFVASTPGVVAVLDTANDDAVTTFELQNVNPFGLFERMPAAAGGDLVIPMVPDFSDFSTGCVERIDIAAGSSSCAITNQELGGLVARIDFETVNDSVVQWMVVASFGVAGPVGNVQGLDLDTDEHIAAITPDTQVIVDLAVCPGNTVVVADATMAANGLRVYAGDAEMTTAPLAVGLKPGSAHGLSCY